MRRVRLIFFVMGIMFQSPALDLLNLTPQDIQSLEALTKEKQAFKEKKRQWKQKMQTLQALGLMVEKKQKELERLEKILIHMTQKHQKNEQLHMKSLVKIYEHMKPPQAALVFLKMDPSYVVDIMQYMREAKASLILAQLPSHLASYVTEQICHRRSINESLKTLLHTPSTPKSPL